MSSKVMGADCHACVTSMSSICDSFALTIERMATRVAGKERLSSIGERIMQAAAERGIHNKNQLAKRMGTDRQTVQRWITGETKNMTHENLFALADVLEKSARWLALGRGPEGKEFSLTPEQRNILDLAGKLNTGQRATWVQMGMHLRDGR